MANFTVFPYDEHFVDLTLIQFGWEQCAPLYLYGPSVRRNFLFHYVLSGTGYVEYTIPGQKPVRYWVAPQSGFLICPNQVVTYCADQTNPWKYAWVEFSGMQAQYRLRLAGLSETSPIYTTDSEQSAAQVENAFYDLVDRPKVAVLGMIGRLYLLLDALVRSSHTQMQIRNQSQNNYYVNEVIAFIHRNYRNKITIDDIAGFLGLSRTHLGRLFKKITGRTLQSYLTQYRISQAVELMRTTELPLGEIAVQVGYANQLYFSKVFRSIYGVPPSIWRQEKRMIQEQAGKPRFERKEKNDAIRSDKSERADKLDRSGNDSRKGGS